MAYSEVSLCNGALARMGQTRFIQALDEATTEAKLCNLFYPQCRDRLLRDYPWRWATRAFTLAMRNSEPDNPKWEYAYANPSACIRVQSILPNDDDIEDARLYDELMHSSVVIPFEVQQTTDGISILTNKKNAVALCTRRVTDPMEFPTAFADALQWRLAVELALPLTGGKTGLRDNLMQYYLSAKSDAEADDANEAVNIRPPFETDYLDVRS